MRREDNVNDAQFWLDGLTNYGAGIIALVLVFAGVVFMAYKIPPYLKAMSEQAAIANEVIKSNSAFMGEMAKSNQNIAKALELLTPIVDSNIRLLREHDIRAQAMMTELAKISERTSHCVSGGRRKIDE